MLGHVLQIEVCFEIWRVLMMTKINKRLYKRINYN